MRNIILIAAVWLLPGAGLMSQDTRSANIPASLNSFIQSLRYQSVNGQFPEIKFSAPQPGITKVHLVWQFTQPQQQDDWQLVIQPRFKPSFHWAPHLTPTSRHIIAQHVFRSPALIALSVWQQLSIMPDLDLLKKNPDVDWYMDVDAPANKLILGMSKSSVKEHTAFVRAGGGVYNPGKVEFGFYILADNDRQSIANPFRKPVDFLWEHWGAAACERSFAQHTGSMETLVKQTYDWAFHSWKKTVWQEFELNGKQVGAPQFIVNVTQSPNYPGEVNEREFRSIWNQAWFSSLRSAQGLYRYAKRTQQPELMAYAQQTKELALSFPQTNGFFPALIATEMEEVEIKGMRYNRSKGWSTYYFGNSNRNPYADDPATSPFHILDMSYTAYLMLTWYKELEQDQRLLAYATAYANALLKIQDAQGFFPAWLDAKTYKPLPALQQSPETSQSATFLFELFGITGNERYKTAALKAIEAVAGYRMPAGQWEDFETYWSCSDYGDKTLEGKKIIRNNMYKQNNLGIYWTAQALLKAYGATGNEKYLKQGRRALDELLMYQSVWQPPFIYVDAVGGFGVMNFDGEWNDARQSLFAELLVEYGKALDFPQYIKRGLAALKASFWMIYSPENEKTKSQWEAKWKFFGKEDYGFMMENYGHGGQASGAGIGIGEFTIYDWGNGAAAEAYNRMVDHYGKGFVE
ncbi:MAG: hypothetical protein KF862_26050 [Chitinophagaceae bacterium]|nr:hypothetical protein [Chitinophagaceae bacterium]